MRKQSRRAGDVRPPLSELIARLPPPPASGPLASARSSSPADHGRESGGGGGSSAPPQSPLPPPAAGGVAVFGGSSGLLHSTIPAPLPLSHAHGPLRLRRPSIDSGGGGSLGAAAPHSPARVVQQTLPPSSPSRQASAPLLAGQRHWASHASVASLGGGGGPGTPQAAGAARGGGIGTGFGFALAAGDAEEAEAEVRLFGRPVDAALRSAAQRTQWESAGGVVVGEVRHNHAPAPAQTSADPGHHHPAA